MVFKGSCNVNETADVDPFNTSTSFNFNDTGDVGAYDQWEDCGWYSEKDIADTPGFEAYLVLSQILNRFGPIVVLAILNTLIVLKFQRISQELPGALSNNRNG